MQQAVRRPALRSRGLPTHRRDDRPPTLPPMELWDPTGVVVTDLDLGHDVEALRSALRDHGVVFAFVFGSRARGDHDGDSDLDVAGMGRDGRLERPWAILPEGIDLVDLGTAPEWLTGRVAMEGVLLLDDDPAARVHWLADTRKRYLDEAPRRAQFTADFLAARRG